MTDPVWKRLQTIFRKHQEDDNPAAEDTTDSEASLTESIQTQAYKEKEPSRTTSTEEHTLPTSSQEMVIPAIRSVQRSPENAEPKSERTAADVQHKVEIFPSTSPETEGPEAARNIGFRPTLPDQRTKVNDQASIANEPEGPSLPLESVWNVQRVETSHRFFQENIPQPLSGPTETDKKETPIETSPLDEQKPTFGPIQLRREDKPSTETQISDSLPASEQRGEPHEPVEILSPSRPRPPQANLPPGGMSIQRQTQESHPPKDVTEASPVNTVIGPLPADLWWLLGQRSPIDTPASQPDIQRKIYPEQKQAPLAHSNADDPRTTAEHPTETPITPNAIQRQVVSNDPLPSSLSRAEESKHTESLDLDDLARRVYAEVRRRLAAEWERRR